jgi:hypothetical protein
MTSQETDKPSWKPILKPLFRMHLKRKTARKPK